MGPLLSVPVDVGVDMKAWIKLFDELRLGLDLSALNDAFRENNVELFKDVLNNILNNLTIKDLVKVKVKASLVGGDAHVGILNGAPEAMVATVAIVAMLFGICFSGIVATGFSRAVPIVLVAVFMWYWSSNNPKTMVPLKVPGTALQGTGAAPPKPKHILELMGKAKMPRLTHDQENLADTLAETRNSHVIVSQCKHITSAFVAKANSGEDLSYLARTDSASMTCEAANALVKEKVLDLNSAITKCDDANWEKKDRYVQLAEFQKGIASLSKGWTNKLQRLEKQYGSVLSQIKAFLLVSDDFAVAKSAVDRRDRVYEKLTEEVEELQKEIRTLNKKSFLSFTTETVQASRSMMESIVHNSTLSALQKQTVSAALKDVDALFRRRVEASDALAAEQSRLDNLTTELKQEELAIDRQVSNLQADLELATTVKLKEGQGFIRMSGKPNDDNSRRLQEAWDKGEWKKLHEAGSYRSGDFELRYVCELTESQKEAREMQDKLEKDLKEKSNVKAALNPKRETLAKRKQYVQNLIELHGTAKSDYMEASQKLRVGVNNLPPVHLAQVLGLQRVTEAMSQAAKTFQPARAEVENFNQLLDDLSDLLENKASAKVVLGAVAAISVQANDKDISSMILLKELGETKLTDFLLPSVDPGAPWISLEEQYSLDDCERQSPNRVPQVVD